MSAAWALEPMLPGHVDQVLGIERASYPSPWPEEAFLSLTAPDARGGAWVLVDGGRPGCGVRGYACFQILEGELEIHNLAVHPEDRRLGGGTFLLRALLEEARGRGCSVAWLEVRPSNAAALGLYRRFGFEEKGRRRGYYADPGEDALVMRLVLSAGGAAGTPSP